MNKQHLIRNLRTEINRGHHSVGAYLKCFTRLIFLLDSGIVKMLKHSIFSTRGGFLTYHFLRDASFQRHIPNPISILL